MECKEVWWRFVELGVAVSSGLGCAEMVLRH